jgi:hypothetical protein
MWWLGLGILLGIAIYWTITVILVRKVINRHIDNADYLSVLWSPEPTKHRW